MKTLLEYLIAEAKEKKELPTGFQLVSLSGGLSKEAKQILQFSSYKKARTAADTAGGRTRIKNGLEWKGEGKPDTTDPIKFVSQFFEGESKLNDFIDQATAKDARQYGGNTDDGVFLELKGQWKDVGGKGKSKSSIRVIRFWVESTMMAYLGVENVGVGFAYNAGVGLFYVYRV